ncbi:RNA polymerase sigma-70 factor, ECF subfamily protein [Streptomyces spinoverrucosus]|uniref:RNA polymerase sigma factor n=1 Tax=Streptomyces spinoverrucosus TaxID=284043 RepID=A0A4Y3V9F5_9ACTN|nr:sigma-70 family RNA polymerase sigma factor [Streptomyces spinoverrucosus]GEC03494.1 RNA polymerase sigma-70 factor, ECF subfamily protein [Streptomyces spinoverrucosus]GHB35274.1 RNA polymerase sigma-70 factor, ECF subfamily protein [Streptomyces spinoverrucosus]
MTQAPHDQLARVVREHAGRLAAALVHVTGDFATAEDLVQDAVLAALRHWPADGIPQRPDAWLFTVARRRGLDLLRRESRYRSKVEQLKQLEELQWPVQPEPDARLRLIFTCCHPALSQQAQIALTLRVVCGLTTAQIARAFLVRESTVAQRITRAKRKITDAGIPYRIPDADELGARLSGVLAVIYLLFNEGYLSTAERAQSRDLVDDAEWLATLLHRLMPAEPEVAGLLALIRLHRARTAARFGPEGGLVLLQDQDRSRWDREAIGDATRLLTRAAKARRPGPYQLQAAIVACHAEAERWEDTDWKQIVILYDMLLHLAPSPVTRLHRAIALRYVTGPRAALTEVDSLAAELDRYHLFHATRAELLRALGDPDQARDADRRALELTANPAEQAVLQERIAWS